VPACPDWVLIGIGDDAAVVEPPANRVEVLTVDALVEGVHFDRSIVPADAIGHRALAVNLSDVAAMGAEPRLALLSMALPPPLPLEDFDGIVAGFASLAARHRVHLVGGNLTRSPGPLMLDVTVAGSVKRRQALTRAGARPGDALYVSGSIGDAAAGLRMLRAQTSPSPLAESCVERYLRPEPRVRLGVLVGRNRAATACVDLSDGLADGVHQLAQASGVGAIVDTGDLPLTGGARQWFALEGTDPVVESMGGSDDYELLFAVRPRATRRFTAAAAGGRVRVTRIGTCTEDPALLLRHSSGAGTIVTPLEHAGYRHFR
jgi:thiamine-monophosphate kinase